MKKISTAKLSFCFPILPTRSIPTVGPYIQKPFKIALDKQKEKLHRKPGQTVSSSTVSLMQPLGSTDTHNSCVAYSIFSLLAMPKITWWINILIRELYDDVTKIRIRMVMVMVDWVILKMMIIVKMIVIKLMVVLVIVMIMLSWLMVLW